jgi:hypothetical protein
MVDPRTMEYLKALSNARETNKKAVDAAEQICNCESCIEARAKKTISPCKQAEIMNTIRNLSLRRS